MQWLPSKKQNSFDNENLQTFLTFSLVNFVSVMSAQFELRKFMTRISKCLQNIEGLQVLLTWHMPSMQWWRGCPKSQKSEKGRVPECDLDKLALLLAS